MIRRPPRSTLFPLHDALPILVEDDAEVARFVKKGLQEAGHTAEHATNGRDGLFLAASGDRKSTRLNSSHAKISYAVFCLKKKKAPLSTSTAPSRSCRHARRST